ncbi:MAG: ABC transporter ATP-binding protein [Alphaproteobacteria bacterium]|nr:ABC transporter ATP-binding protein [Alphaproteobacteria bacterium]
MTRAGQVKVQTDSSVANSNVTEPNVKESTGYLVGRLWRDWMRAYTGRIAGAVVLMVIVAATSAAYPWLIEQAIDMLTNADPRILTVMPAAIIAITVTRGLASYGQSVLNQSMSLRVIANLQKAMFARLMHADLAMMQSAPTGTLISRFTNDVNLMRDALSRTFTTMVRELLTAVFLIAMMFYQDWVLALIVFVTFPIAGRPIIRLGRRLRRASANVQTGLGDLTATLNQSFGGIRLIKAYGMEGYENKRSEGLFDEVYRLIMKTVKGRARTQPIMEILGGVAVALVLAYGGYRVTSGTGTLGEFVGFLSAVIMVLQPLRSLGNFNASLQEGLAAVKRSFDLIDSEPEITERPDARPLTNATGRVQLDGVTFGYGDGTAALDNVTIDVPAGQTVALVGPSGAGKSTVLNLIPRFYDTDAGAVRIDGDDVREVTLASLRDHIALVSQDVTLFNESIAANIGFGDPTADRAAIEAAAVDAAAHDFITQLPDGYDTIVGERGAKLSGGERQRIAIARAMLKNAPILLFDEATSALDAEAERQVQGALARLAKDRTTIVIAHRLATVVGADLIYVIDDGRVVETGVHDQLLALNGLYARLARLQFRTDDGGNRTEKADAGANG